LTFIQYDDPERTQKWKDLVADWLDYKREIKNSYKSGKLIEAFSKELLKLSSGNGEDATIALSGTDTMISTDTVTDNITDIVKNKDNNINIKKEKIQQKKNLIFFKNLLEKKSKITKMTRTYS
jgi:hypothetical protein